MTINIEEIEYSLNKINREAYETFSSLPKFYRSRLIMHVVEKFSLKNNNKHIIAYGIINAISIMDSDTVNNFWILGKLRSDINYLQKSIKCSKNKKLLHSKNYNLHRHSEKIRRNFRRYTRIPENEDEIQQKYDSDIIAEREKYIINITASGRRITAQDALEFRRDNKSAKFRMMLQCLDASTKIMGFQPFFLSLTLPGNYRETTYEDARKEISKRLNSIKAKMKRENIPLIGISKIHGHDDETPHLHLVLYIKNEQIETTQNIVFHYFNNDKERIDNAFKEVYDFSGCLSYIFNDFCTNKKSVDVRFIGLRKNIHKIWDAIYDGNFGNTALSYLSDRRLLQVRPLIHRKENLHDILFVLRGFADDSINEISRWNMNTKHIDNINNKKFLFADMQIRIHGRCSIISHHCSKIGYRQRKTAVVIKFIRNNQEGEHSGNNLRCRLDFQAKQYERSRSLGQPPPGSPVALALVRPMSIYAAAVVEACSSGGGANMKKGSHPRIPWKSGIQY